MSRDREEIMRIAAERARLKKEKEAREEKELYARITSGWQWIIFKVVVVFCSLMVVVSTIEVFVDGPSKKLTDKSWEIDHNWSYPWHSVLNVEGYMFTPKLEDWLDHKDSTLTMTYSPIFRTGKKLVYEIEITESVTRHHEEIRQRSIFTWFPFLQIFLLIPLFTFLFRRQSAWFNFARVASLVIVFPGTLFVIFFALM